MPAGCCCKEDRVSLSKGAYICEWETSTASQTESLHFWFPVAQFYVFWLFCFVLFFFSRKRFLSSVNEWFTLLSLWPADQRYISDREIRKRVVLKRLEPSGIFNESGASITHSMARRGNEEIFWRDKLSGFQVASTTCALVTDKERVFFLVDQWTSYERGHTLSYWAVEVLAEV